MKKIKKILILGIIAIFAFPLNALAVIAYDSNTFCYDALHASPTNCTFNNVAGDIVLVYFQSTFSGDIVTSVTYGGNAMTRLSYNSRANGDDDYLYVLLNPPTGSNTIAINWTAEVADLSIVAVSYSGIGAYEAVTTAYSGSGTTISNTITPTVDNSWVVTSFRSNFIGAISAGAGTTIRGTATNFNSFYDNNAAINPATATTLNGTGTLSGVSFGIGVALNPPVASSPSITSDLIIFE